MASLGISRRAARDIEEIHSFSVDHWGNRVAEEYLNHIEETLHRLQQNPTLLRIKPEFSRLAQLEPTLLEETDLLHKTFLAKIRSRSAGSAN